MTPLPLAGSKGLAWREDTTTAAARLEVGDLVLIDRMKTRPRWLLLAMALALTAQIPEESPTAPPPEARVGDPVYTVYAAPPERSRYLPDHAYQLVLKEGEPLAWVTEYAGGIALGWAEDEIIAGPLEEYHQSPTLMRSFSDGAELGYSPFRGLDVRHRFAVYSSSFLLHELQVNNRLDEARNVHFLMRLKLDQPLRDLDVPRALDQVFFRHHEPPDAWSETRVPGAVYVLENILLTRPGFSAQLLDEQGRALTEDALLAFRRRRRKKKLAPWGVQLTIKLELPPQRQVSLRWLRGIDSDSQIRLWAQAERLLTEVDLADVMAEAESRQDGVPHSSFSEQAGDLSLRQLFRFLRQLMLPAEGTLERDFYVVSREPTRGSFHDGQSLPDSVALLAHVFLDPQAAQESQRIFIDAQKENGYIPHRVGPFANREYTVKGRPTTSAPFFNWVNWELFRVTRDEKFLAESYAAGSRFVRYLMRSRDLDHDGLYEWGGDARRESARARHNVIWDSLGKAAASAGRVEALDLNCILVKELDSLALAARTLGFDSEASQWTRERDALAERVSRQMWDAETGFFYHLGRESNSFSTRKGLNLRRREIIGFLPLWAGIASEGQTHQLIGHLTDPNQFWRARGIPSLSADDPEYLGRVDACCRFDGSVHPLWNYLVFRGLLDQGYRSQAEEVARRLSLAAVEQLSNRQLFLESYSPDSPEVGHRLPAITTALIARMHLDLKR